MKYFITADAGPMVAGKKNPGEGEQIELTPAQAEHPLRLGHIRRPLDHDGNGTDGGTRDGVSPVPRSAPMQPTSPALERVAPETADKAPAARAKKA